MVPGKKATGTNTATSTRPMTTTAPNTSRMASMAARYEVFLIWVMWRSMFSITTIASSTTIPVASTIPKRVRVLMEKLKSLTKAKVPISETGMVMVGDQGAAPVLQEEEHHQDDEGDGFEQGDEHLLDRLAHDAHVVEGQPPFEARREGLLQPGHLLHDPLEDGQRVGRGQELDARCPRPRAPRSAGWTSRSRLRAPPGRRPGPEPGRPPRPPSPPRSRTGSAR